MESKRSADRVERNPLDDVVEMLELRSFIKLDRGYYYEFVPKPGIVMNKEGVVMISGKELAKEYNQKHGAPRYHYSVPRLSLKFPKKVPPNMTFEILEAQVRKEAVKTFCANFKKVKKAHGEKPQGLGDNLKSMVSGQTAGAEADNMEKEPLTNNLEMKEMDSALDNSAKGKCDACGVMDQESLTNNLEMKELNSALDSCAKGICAACRGAGSFEELKAN